MLAHIFKKNIQILALKSYDRTIKYFILTRIKKCILKISNKMCIYQIELKINFFQMNQKLVLKFLHIL